MPFNEVKGWGALKRAGREIEPPGLSLSVSKQPTTDQTCCSLACQLKIKASKQRDL